MIPDRTQKIDSKKFESIFKSLDSQMKKQTIVLESILSIEQDRKLDEERKNQLEEMKYDEEKMRRKANEDRERVTEPDNIPKQEQSSGIGPALAGLLGFELGKADISSVWDLAIKAGFIGIIAKPLSDFMGGMIARSLEKLGLDESVSAGAADIIADTGVALLAGKILGSVLGKRFGMALAIGGLIYTKLDDIFDKNQDGFIDAFGGQFSTTWVSGLGAVIGGVVMLYLPTILRGGLSALFKRVVPSAIAAIGTGTAATSSGIFSKMGKGLVNFGSKLPLGAGKVIAGATSLPATAAMFALSPSEMGDGTLTGFNKKAIDNVDKNILSDTNRTETDKVKSAVNVFKKMEENGTLLPYIDVGEEGKVIKITKEMLLDPSFWTERLKYLNKSSSYSDIIKENRKGTSQEPVPGVEWSPDKPGVVEFKNIDPSTKWRFNNKSLEKYGIVDKMLKETKSQSNSSSNSSTINDNKVSSVKGDSIINNITHITTPPSYSLNHFIPS